MEKKSKLHVIIVNFRTSFLTIRCVKSMLAESIVGKDGITIVENFSQDDSEEKLRQQLPGISIVSADRNGGFGAGVNLGAQHASGEYLLILNPDTYFEFDSVSPITAYMDAHPDVGLVGMDLVNPDGSRQYSARRFYSMLDVCARRLKGLKPFMKKRIDRHLMMDAWQRDEPFDAEWVMGTGFIVRRDLYNKLGGMDESYFLYMEDVDLCARVWQAGYRVKCLPGVKLVHDHQRSSAAGPFTRAGRNHLRSLALFASRYTLPLVKPPGVKKIVSRAKS